MDNQERNREALIEHIDELQRIIRRRNQQIENQAQNAEEDQRVIEVIGAERDEYRAMHSEQMKTIARLQKNPRPEGAEELQALIRQAEAEGEGADNEALANYLAARLADPTVKEQS